MPPAASMVCDIHHIRYWHNDGRTDIAIGALLCGHHHTAVHHDGWTIDFNTQTNTLTATKTRHWHTTTRTVTFQAGPRFTLNPPTPTAGGAAASDHTTEGQPGNRHLWPEPNDPLNLNPNPNPNPDPNLDTAPDLSRQPV